MSAVWTPSAELSACGMYRFRLRRERPLKLYGGHVLAVTMLNPSTADAQVDDPTIRRLVGFADREHCDVLDVTNLWPFRATDPAELEAAALRGFRIDGGHLQDTIASISASAFETRVRGGKWVVAWGAGIDRVAPAGYVAGARHQPARGRAIRGSSAMLVQRVLAAVPATAHCFGVTKGGHPKHPLYLASDTPIVPFEVPRG